jgi:DNA mismatch repair protein MutS
MAAAAIVLFLQATHQQHLEHILKIKIYRPEKYLTIDAASRRNLEITGNLREGGKQGSLFSILDLCHTSMGKRLLRRWLELPLREVGAINERLDGVEELFRQIVLREQLAVVLKRIYDMERLSGKLGSGLANPRDLLALKSSCLALKDLISILQKCQNETLRHASAMDNLDDLAGLIDLAIEDDAPLAVKEGGLIKPGFDEEIDELKQLSNEGSAWLVDYENKEKERTGIKHLKVGFNKVFGYYLEISRSNLHLVPPDYIRKQTLVNTERFITEPLKQYEDKILGARERLFALEYEVFAKVRNALAGHLQRIQDSAGRVAAVDVLLSLAECAFRNDYVRPRVDESGKIEIKGGRHPVVEQFLQDGRFVPNDIRMDSDQSRFMLITGPNMGGKSTYMRQTALIVILAQIGSFVPAREAHIGVADQVFTRVGASDDLASGQSTFMVEMVEVANILHNASLGSLVILDEIGRGTSTFDGLSIARAVSEDLANRIKARTLFATHYHELTSLAEDTNGIVNLSVSVKETGDTVVFLKKVLPGKADKSYGIHVASLAGLPGTVLKRAEEILNQLENRPQEASASLVFEQPALFAAENPLLTELRRLDVDSLSPREALNILYRWKSEFN